MSSFIKSTMGSCSSTESSDDANVSRSDLELGFDEVEAAGEVVVRKIKRKAIVFSGNKRNSTLGAGYFGSVMKAVCDESSEKGGVPGYLVAVK